MIAVIKIQKVEARLRTWQKVVSVKRSALISISAAVLLPSSSLHLFFSLPLFCCSKEMMGFSCQQHTFLIPPCDKPVALVMYMNILSSGSVIPAPALDVVLLLLLWHVQISLLSLHLAVPALLLFLEFSLKPNSRSFSFRGAAGTLTCKRSSSVQEKIAADHCWVSSPS